MFELIAFGPWKFTQLLLLFAMYNLFFAFETLTLQSGVEPLYLSLTPAAADLENETKQSRQANKAFRKRQANRLPMVYLQSNYYNSK